MAGDGPGGARRGAARRKKYIGAVALLAVLALGRPDSRAAATANPAPIKIPPAQIPPPAAAPAPPPVLVPAPAALLPIDVAVVLDPPGDGLAMYGPLGGKAESALGVVLSIFANSGAFDAPPAQRLMLADTADRHAQALFAGQVQGQPVLGIAAAALDATGGDTSLLYDRVDALAGSFPRLRQGLGQMATVEIGVADNSAADGERAGAYFVAAGWAPVIAAASTADDPPIDGELVQALVDGLTHDTGDKWRVVPPGDAK